MSTSSELRKYDREQRLIKRAEDRYARVTKAISKKITDLSKTKKDVIKENSAYVNKKIYYERMKPFAELDIYAWKETESPIEYEDAIKTIEKAVKGVKNNEVHKLMAESDIDPLTIAENIYLRAIDIEITERANSEEENAKKAKMLELGEGFKIGLYPLVVAIEEVTDLIIRMGITEAQRKRPFFFRD